MSDIPESVYRDAAVAMTAVFRPESTASAGPDLWAESAWFRAAVESAYRAGQSDLAERVRALAVERIRAGHGWPAGTRPAAESIRNMLIALVDEAEGAREP